MKTQNNISDKTVLQTVLSTDTSPKHPVILTLGSSGFVGRHVMQLLNQTSVKLLTPSHNDVDFINPDWQNIASLLQDVDMVINTVGVMDSDDTVLDKVHHKTPLAIAKLAKSEGVRRWINLSALGAIPSHDVPFLASKGRGDEALLTIADTCFKVSVVRPSLIYGKGGASSGLFLSLAKLPVLILPDSGKQLIQPVHISDVAQGIFELTTDNQDDGQFNAIINFTGEQACTLADYLSTLRANIYQKRHPVILNLPYSVAAIAIFTMAPFSKGMITQDSLKLLAEGSKTDNIQSFEKLLKRKPLNYTQFKQFKKFG